jgi:hypothetical protein
MPLLQAGVLKHPVVGKWMLEEMGIRKNDCEGGVGEGAGLIGKDIGAGQPAIRVVFLWLFYWG